MQPSVGMVDTDVVVAFADERFRPYFLIRNKTFLFYQCCCSYSEICPTADMAIQVSDFNAEPRTAQQITSFETVNRRVKFMVVPRMLVCDIDTGGVAISIVRTI